MSYSQKLKDPRWQKKRLEILSRDNFSCRFCGDTKTELQVHHKSYFGEPWEQANDELLTLCRYCHNDLRFVYYEVPIEKSLIIQKEGLRLTVYLHHDGLSSLVFSNNDSIVNCQLMTNTSIQKINDFLNGRG